MPHVRGEPDRLLSFQRTSLVAVTLPHELVFASGLRWPTAAHGVLLSSLAYETEEATRGFVEDCGAGSPVWHSGVRVPVDRIRAQTPSRMYAPWASKWDSSGGSVWERSTQFFVLRNEDTMVVCIRGTQSDIGDHSDFLVDAFAGARSMETSLGDVALAGFHLPAIYLANRIQLLDAKRVFTFGHSLGGAVAAQLARMWASAAETTCVTFGEPPSFLQVKSPPPRAHFRFVRHGDPVANLDRILPDNISIASWMTGSWMTGRYLLGLNPLGFALVGASLLAVSSYSSAIARAAHVGEEVPLAGSMTSPHSMDGYVEAVLGVWPKGADGAQ